jgi:hypothetical protein
VPFLVRHRRCWSFRNGFYKADGDLFVPYGPHVVLPEEQACKYIPFDLTDYESIQGDYKIENGVYKDLKGKSIGLGADKKERPLRKRWMDIRTPYMDRLLKDQGFSYLVRKWIYVFLGRLAFELGVDNGGDNWQVCLFIFGKAGTGKTTLVSHILNMYDADDIFDMVKGENTR